MVQKVSVSKQNVLGDDERESLTRFQFALPLA